MGLDMHDSEMLRQIKEAVTKPINLRDRFAMAALTGFMALTDERTYSPTRADCEGLSLEEWQAKISKQDANYLYQVADAMIEARKVQP